MIIGTVRSEEALIHDTWAGYHQFHAEITQEPYGSFEIFWHQPSRLLTTEEREEAGELDLPAGWYWRAGFPGCLPDGEPSGPFATSRAALEDAGEWHPEFDE